MPVISGSDIVNLNLPGGPSATGEINGINIPDVLTDVEDLWSDGDEESSVLKRKAALVVPQQDKGAITDTEDMDFSGEDNDFIQEETNLPTVQNLGRLPEPTREIINLTEGFARVPSPLLSDSEPEVDDVEGKHKKNIKKMEMLTELQVPDKNVADELTDVEDIVASGDEVEEAAKAIEDSLPEHYMDQGEGVSVSEKLSAVTPAPKIFLTDGDDSSDEQCHKTKPRQKSKGGLKVEVKEDITDVEDLDFSDKGDDLVKSVCNKNKAKDKPRKKEQVQQKVHKPVTSKTLITSSGDDGLTDVESLTGDEEEEETLEDGESHLTVPEHDDAITDSEDMEASDTEDVEALFAKPIKKLEPSVIPDPHAEKVKISETEKQTHEESGVDTDEEGFAIEDQDDERPSHPLKKITHEPLVAVDKEEALDVEEPCETVLTDTEDFDLEDKEEEEIMKDVASHIPEEGKIYTLQELEDNMGCISKTEMIKDVHEELRQKIKEAELAGKTLQEALNDENLTDVEDLNDGEKTISKQQRQDNESDEESVKESDIEEEIPKKTKQGKRRGKRLPVAPQISDVRFIETKQGPLSIIITPDAFEKNPDRVPKDQITNVIFLETEQKESTTDVEDLGLSDDGENKNVSLKTPGSSQEPTTDTEELDFDPAELDRPHSPLPPNIQHNVFSSPKRELIHIKDDKYGVPQVTIRKLGPDELFVSDVEDAGVTDTEDIEMSSDCEALRIVGVTEDSSSEFELPDSGRTEVSSKMIQRDGLQVEPEEDEGSTDVEELPIKTRKSRRKSKNHSKLSTPKIKEADSHTDDEILSDQDDKSNLKVRVESPGAHTDVEDFETSEAEELELPTTRDAPTPDIIVNAAIKRIIMQKEGPDGVVETDEVEIAPARKHLLPVQDESESITDVEDMEASGAEDEDNLSDYPAIELPYDETSSVDISEKSSLPKANNEAKLIKDNLLLPEDNYNNLTDVESLSEGEGNRCASNTSLLSSQQLTYAVESRTVEELSYYLPSTTDPKLCVYPGVSLESDPFCAELTSPVVVEAELEQVYYHAPKEGAHVSEVELEANDGCVVRKRQVVASLCQAREIRRFWSLDRNSPLHQSEINAFATPTIHKKGFKTILYLEQPNLLDTISISDTLCDSSYFRNERLLDFETSSIDSFDDHFSYRDSDIVTVVDRFNQERRSSFDDLPSPHLSSIGSTGVIDTCSGISFGSDPQYYDSLQSPRPYSSNSRYSSEDLRKESDLTISFSGTSVHSCSPDFSLQQEVELSLLNVGENSKCYKETHFEYNDNDSDEITIMMQAQTSNSPHSPFNTEEKPYHCSSLHESYTGKDEFAEEGSIDNCIPTLACSVSEIIKGPAVECHEGFTTECIVGYASKHGDASAAECIESDTLENREGFTTECIKGYATECIESSVLESLEDLVSDYVEIDTTSCIKNSPTAYVQRSITEWVVGHSTDKFERHSKNQDPNIQKEPFKTCSQMSIIQYTSKPVSKCLGELTSKSVSRPTTVWLTNPLGKYQTNQNSQTASDLECVKEIKPASSSSNMDSFSSLLLQSSECSNKPFEDSGVHEYQTSRSFISSFDAGDKLNRLSFESDHVSLADSVLGLEDQLDRESLQDDTNNSITYISAQFSPASKVTHSQFQYEKYSKKDFEEVTRYPAVAVPHAWRHTLPRTCSQLKTNEKLSSKIAGNIAKDFEERSKDFGGVKGLIDQWEVIVREEKLGSLPASPAVGRKILPFDGNKRASWGNFESEARDVFEGDHTKVSLNTNLGEGKCEDLDSYDGGSVIEEVASVCDIIQQFEGRVGRLGKINAHRQRLPRGSQSPASRSPSHPRRVATVKPLCEPQLHQEKSLPLQEGQMQQHQDHFQELMEHTVSAGFVPRVVESLSITKSSNDIWEENPPQASVSNPEGTHEAAQIAEQQPTTLSQDQGLEVEEMSNIMESYTSDGSDLITTTYTTTSIDPDPITSTQTTRIIRRTQIEKDGEVKEDAYEEY